MCVLSFVGDHYSDKWRDRFPIPQPYVQPWTPPPITREEFDALKKEVEGVKELLLKAKQYDKDHGEPDCEMEEKVEILRKVAELVGIDLSEVFTK